MHAPVGIGRRRGFQLQPRPRDEVNHFVMSDFALSNDHDMAMLLQGRGKSKINHPAAFSANSRPIHGGGGVDEPLQARNFDPCAHTARKKDVTASMSADAKLFPADGYAGIGGVSNIICSPEEGGDTVVRAQDDQHKNHGSDLLHFDWPELDGLEDLETDLRKLDSAFEIGSNYFDDPLWTSICSPDEVQLVPSSHSDDPRPSYAADESATEINPTLKSTVSVSDAGTIDQRPPGGKKEGSGTPLNCSSSSSVETEHFPRLSDADLLCPFDDMIVPTSSSIMCNDEILPRSGGPDGPLVSAYVHRGSSSTKKPAPTPDMMLEEMAGNPLEMYFPPLTTYEQEQPQLPMTGAAWTRQLLPQGLAGDGALGGAGSQLGSKGGRSPAGEAHPTAPVKQHFGFQKLQEGMNQLDVGTKTCIRDALYRLANSVEQRHCVADQSVGSSSIANSRKTASSVWSETERSPMDRSVAQLLLQKPPCRKTAAADRRTNRAA